MDELISDMDTMNLSEQTENNLTPRSAMLNIPCDVKCLGDSFLAG